MKIFHASYNYRGRYGYFEEEELIIFAETNGVALGKALEWRSDSHRAYWTIEELTEDMGIVYISSDSS